MSYRNTIVTAPPTPALPIDTPFRVHCEVYLHVAVIADQVHKGKSIHNV